MFGGWDPLMQRWVVPGAGHGGGAPPREAPYATLNDKGEDGASGPAAATDADACLIKETNKEQWDLLVMLLIIYSAVAVPLRLCFRAKAEGIFWAFEASLSLVFLADLALTFNTVPTQGLKLRTSPRA